MADENQPGVDAVQGGEPQSQQGYETSPTDVSVDGDLTQEAQPSEGWENPLYRKGILDKTFRGGYADGRKKGARDTEARILKEFGVDSVEALKEAFSQRELAEQQKADQDSQAQSKLIRGLKEERSTLAKQVQGLQGQLSRFELQASRALNAEIKTTLLSMGAHEGVDDLVQIAVQSLAWSTDGGDIEVVDRLPDGSVQPARETLQEYLEHLKQTKPWYFRTLQKQGSGSLPDKVSTSQAPKDTDTFASRMRRFYGR